MKKTSNFVLTVCQVGAEPVLKEEISRNHPDLRFAYSRPGFVTFKAAEGGPLSPDYGVNSVFARAHALSVGKIDAKSSPQLAARVAKVLEGLESLENAQGRDVPLRLHVFERDLYAPGEEPLGFSAGAWAFEAERAIRERGGDAFYPDSIAQNGDLVLSVVLVEENEWWLGLHRHSAGRSPYAGGAPRIRLPSESPSRAYLKLEEAVLVGGLPLRAGDTAVEIGSAPGGASYALLERGLRVVGIDPGAMDDRVMSHPNFHHIQRVVAQVPREELPDRIDWLLLDMNVSPSVTLFQVDRLATRMRDSLLGVILTLKLNEWKIAREIPSMLDHVAAMGMTRVRARQLYHNRQEIMVSGLTRKGGLR